MRSAIRSSSEGAPGASVSARMAARTAGSRRRASLSVGREAGHRGVAWAGPRTGGTSCRGRTAGRTRGRRLGERPGRRRPRRRAPRPGSPGRGGGGVALRHAERHGPADRVRQPAHPRDLVRKALVVVAGHARWRDLEQARPQLAERGADAEQLVVVGERPRYRGAVERLVEAGTRRREAQRAGRDPLLHERGHPRMSSAVAGSLRAPRSPIT